VEAERQIRAENMHLTPIWIINMDRVSPWQNGTCGPLGAFKAPKAAQADEHDGGNFSHHKEKTE
jgi:hypothetical protein